MKFYKKLETDWVEPLNIASSIKGNFAFLYSSLNAKYSYIGFLPDKEIKGDDFKALEQLDDNFYFGYLAYDLKNSLENLPVDQDLNLKFPLIWFYSYQVIYEFNHHLKKLTIYYKDNIDPFIAPSSIQEINTTCTNIASNMNKQEYLTKVREIKRLIEEGVIYQANLTRKFFGNINLSHCRPIDLFAALCKISPANYSAFLKFDDSYIISSSPELFLKIENENAISIPIKGSAPRGGTIEEDEQIKQELSSSIKDRAENLMIVDLTRNDFSRGCKPGTVKVPELFKIDSYAHIHHMSSLVIGEKKENISNIDFIKNCFPPPSMTGTPKIQMMKECSLLEQYKRLIYSGALGIISNELVNLSVVIRTLILQKDYFEFQVGGAIVYDSSPEKEYEETLIKAKGICKLLGIDISGI